MATPGEPPRAFVSYSWTSDEHVGWVVSLCEKLRADGVDIVLDQWDLKEGYDKFHFMERMVTDPTVKKVLVVSDQLYADKADGRRGGVGHETLIISKDVYDSMSQETFIPLVRERDAEGKECLPVFLRNRMYIDFSDDEKFGEAYERLIRNIFGRPERQKPPLGKPPAHLFTETTTHVKAAGKFERLKDAVNRGRPHTQALLQEYLDTFVEAMEDFRVTYQRGEKPFDEIVIESATAFLPYRDNFIDFVMFTANYMNDEDSYERIHSFLEHAAAYQFRPEKMQAWNEESFDNYRFILYELFLHLIACLIKAKRYSAAACFIEAQYNVLNLQGGSQLRQRGNGAFNEHNRTIDEYRKQRLQNRRYCIVADMIKERATHTAVQFRHLLQVDILLFARPAFPEPGHSGRWYPRCAVFGEEAGVLDLFARATSPHGIKALSQLLHINDLKALHASLHNFFETESFKRTTQVEWSWHVDWGELFNFKDISRALGIKPSDD